MSNTPEAYDVAAEKAVKAMQDSLFKSGLTETEAMIVLRSIVTNLNKALNDYVGRK